MKQAFNLYFLYCKNLQCKNSIFHQMVEVQIPFTIENLMATHMCTCCGKPLVSAVNIDINRATEEANSKIYQNQLFNN
jgi:hypothetical protein